MMTPTQFSGVCLVTGDVPRLRRFYEQALQVGATGDDSPAILEVQGAQLTLFPADGIEDLAPGAMQGAGTGCVILEFAVEDVDRAAERLTGLGAPQVKPPQTHPWGRRSAWFRDPDGNLLNLYSAVAG